MIKKAEAYKVKSNECKTKRPQIQNGCTQVKGKQNIHAPKCPARFHKKMKTKHAVEVNVYRSSCIKKPENGQESVTLIVGCMTDE